MADLYFSQRNALNPNPNGLPLAEVIALFERVFDELVSDGYFTEAFGFHCVDAGFVRGTILDVDLAIFLEVRKKNLWPIRDYSSSYSEDDFFDG